jgi:DNA repair exonuclease SbcCD ATPase subunit
METQEETKGTLQDKFAEFQSEVQKLRQKPAGLESQLSDLQGKLSRLKTGRAANLAQDEMKKSEILAEQIKKLEPKIEVIEAKLQALGPGGKESVQALVAAAPGSPLYDLALDIVAQAAETCPDLEAELREFVNYGAEELKRQYLDKIGAFSERLSALWQIAFAGLTAQQYLPEDLRSCKRPRLIPPNQASFEIDVMEIAEHYRPLSRTSLPD